MNRIDGEGRYVSYLLRLWQAQSQEGLVWRASLEQATTGARRGFASLADLLAFLEQVTASVKEDRPDSPECGSGNPSHIQASHSRC